MTFSRVGRDLRNNPLLVAGTVIMLLIVLFGVLGPPVLGPKNAEVGAFKPRLAPTSTHLLGTDGQGRDMLAAMALATPQTLRIGLIAGAVGIALGVILGLLSGYFGGTLDTVIRVFTDVWITIPGMAIMIVVATLTRNVSVELMALLVALLAWRFPARAIRAQTLSLRERAYVQIARLNGGGGLELVVKEILPNLLPYIAASFVSAVSQSILTAIGLETLGLGPQETLTLGMIIYWGQFYGAILRGLWWWWAPPIVLIVLIFVGLLFLSAGMDQFVNTRLRRVA